MILSLAHVSVRRARRGTRRVENDPKQEEERRKKNEEKNGTNWSVLYVFQSNTDDREAINHRTKAVR